MKLLPPGNILQNLYFKERIAALKPRTFCEIGCGNGHVSRILLSMGLSGKGYDLNASACENNRQLNAEYIRDKKYEVNNTDFIQEEENQKFDLIFSCMVIEHLDDDTVQKYMDKCKSLLNKNGVIAVFVPSSMKHWGIEDVIAGHFRRYSYQALNDLAEKNNLRVNDMAGLTVPLGNWLFSLSNKLIEKGEGHKQALSMQEQTVQSGNRNVKYKTVFPWYTAVILNELSMYPFHILQKLYRRNEDALVIYCEYVKL